MKIHNYHYYLLKLLTCLTLYSCSVSSKLYINLFSATNSSKIEGTTVLPDAAMSTTSATSKEKNGTTTIDPKQVVIFRMWHSFDPEKLQNMDGIPGNDLMPLPNSQQHPYQDILLKASAEHPQILIYDGKQLSEKQIQMFEDLHQKTKNRHGTLFVLDFNAIIHQLSDADFLSDSRFTNQVSNDNLKKADYIDLFRLIVLYNMDTVLQALKEKYHHDYDFHHMLYADFDRKIEDVLEDICRSTCTSYRGIRVPMGIYPQDKSSQPGQRGGSDSLFKTFSAQMENNLILCTETKTPVILDMINSFKKKKDSHVFYSFCQALVDSIEKKYNQEPPTVGAKLSFDMQGVKFELLSKHQPITEQEFMKLYKSYLACGLIIPNLNLDCHQDQTWAQDVNSMIINASRGIG